MRKRFLFKATSTWIVPVTILLSVHTFVYSQVTIRALGMGNAYTALARGVHAADWNPANLGLPDNPKFSMSFFSIGLHASNNSFTPNMYNKYIGKNLTPGQVSNILSSIPDSGLRLGFDGTLRVFSFSVGRFAMTIGGDFGGYGNIEKTVFELIFKGNELYKPYRFDDIKASGVGVGLIGLSYGSPIQVDFAEIFTVGATLNMYYGLGYAKVEKSDFTLLVDDYGFNLNGSYKARTALGSGGWGLNIGSAAKINDKITVSLALSNLINSLSWSNDVQEVEGHIYGDSIAVMDFNDDDKKDAIDDSSWTMDGHKFTSRLPVQLRLGGMYTEGDFVMTADYTQAFQSDAWFSTTPQFTFGTEWRKVKWLPLRMGVLLGGRFGFGSSFGFGLRPGGFVWDFAIMNRGFISPNGSKGFIFGTEIGLDL